MEPKTNYTLVGLIVVLLTAALVVTIVWLSSGLSEKTYDTFMVYMSDGVPGLAVDAPVKYNGVPVGYVRDIRLDKSDPRRVALFLDIERGIPITTSTTATLVSQGITGVSHIGLSASTGDLTPLKKSPGQKYPVIPSSPSLFNQIDKLVNELSRNITQLSKQARLILNDENAQHISRFLSNVDKASHDFPSLVKDFKSAVVDFQGMAESLSQAGTSVSSTMRSGRNTLDKFSQETLAPMATLLRRLNSIAVNIEDVSADMRENPSVIIRGKQPPQPGPGE